MKTGTEVRSMQMNSLPQIKFDLSSLDRGHDRVTLHVEPEHLKGRGAGTP